jgi:hypothetical protein
MPWHRIFLILVLGVGLMMWASDKSRLASGPANMSVSASAPQAVVSVPAPNYSGLDHFAIVDDSGFRLPTTDGELHWLPNTKDCYITFWIDKRLGTFSLPASWCIQVAKERP